MSMFQLSRTAILAIGLGTLTACGGGGAAEPIPVSLSFSSAGSTATEGGSAHSVSVQLNMLSGSLESEVTVEALDLGSGTATDGVDYTSLPTTLLTFPIGSVDGATQSFSLATLADSSVEGAEETVRLSLGSATGATVMGVSEHLVTITDSDRAEIGFALSSTTTPDEATTDYALTVTMTLDPGDSLDADVSVSAADAGTGDATPGSDYTQFESETLTFPAGSASGATQTVTFSVQDDTDYELDETVVLSLTPASGSVDLGSNADHSVTITNDDVSPVPFLAVTPGSGSPGSSMSSGQTLDFGTQAVGAGPTGGLTVTLENLGTASMDVSVLNLSGNAGDFSIETVTAMPPPPPAALPQAVFPMHVVGMTTDEGTALELSPELLAQVSGLDHVLVQGVPLPEGDLVDLALERLPSPWRPHSVLAVNGVEVEGGPEALLGDLSLWRGAVVGHPDSSLFLSFSEHGSAGWLRLSPDPADLLHLLTESPADTPRVPQSRLVRASLMEAFSVEPSPNVCLAAPLPPWGMDPALLQVPDPDGEPETAKTSALTVAEAGLVLETDFQYWQIFGDTTAATTYVTQLVAAISDRYEKDIQTTLAINYLGLHDNAIDGWTSPDTPGADTADMLAEFRGAWGSTWPVPGDLAHFISGASLGGGIAYVGVLCSPSFGYGVSANMNGAINWGTFSGDAHPLNWDFVVMAHELGHNFGANHTHSYCPPLDTCYANCSGGTSCQQGTLMSYCHLCAGGLSKIDPEFHPHVASVMRGQVDASCLGDSTLPGGSTVGFTVSFEPTTAAGNKSAVLSFSHSASNQPSPFQLNLTGTSTP